MFLFEHQYHPHPRLSCFSLLKLALNLFIYKRPLFSLFSYKCIHCSIFINSLINLILLSLDSSSIIIIFISLKSGFYIEKIVEFIKPSLLFTGIIRYISGFLEVEYNLSLSNFVPLITKSNKFLHHLIPDSLLFLYSY